jgi:hypothetical protein
MDEELKRIFQGDQSSATGFQPIIELVNACLTYHLGQGKDLAEAIMYTTITVDIIMDMYMKHYENKEQS